MTSTTTAHIYAQTQHNEYEAQAAQNYKSEAVPTLGAKQEMIMGKIAQLLQQIRDHADSQDGGSFLVESGNAN